MKNSHFQFKRPVLSEVSYKTNESFKPESTEALTITYEVEHRRNDEISATVRVKINIGDTTPAAPFLISISMQADFKWDDSFSEKDLQSLLEGNAPSLIIAYARPIIALITSSTKYPSFDLPFLDLRRDTESSEDEMSGASFEL